MAHQLNVKENVLGFMLCFERIWKGLVLDNV